MFNNSNSVYDIQLNFALFDEASKTDKFIEALTVALKEVCKNSRAMQTYVFLYRSYHTIHSTKY